MQVTWKKEKLSGSVQMSSSSCKLLLQECSWPVDTTSPTDWVRGESELLPSSGCYGNYISGCTAHEEPSRQGRTKQEKIDVYSKRAGHISGSTANMALLVIPAL